MNGGLYETATPDKEMNNVKKIKLMIRANRMDLKKIDKRCPSTTILIKKPSRRGINTIKTVVLKKKQSMNEQKKTRGRRRRT